MKKPKLLLSVLACVLLLATTACSCKAPAKAESIQVQIESIDPKNGLRILLIPRDNKGLLVETEGILSAKLWPQIVLNGKVHYDSLIQEWSGIPITNDNYTQPQGVKIDLLYDTEQLFLMIYGSIEVALLTPDGDTLTYTLNNIAISEPESYGC